ncbi:MAG TPA: ATP-binding cassette domain-containing protein [Gemmatimonadales bacterium]|nr:ATP-binding cassette domain-containing protein [Gemmatimonadales bacterium]
MSAAPVLELVGIARRFGPVQALGGADFALASGEVHALLGENGAGKSTLLHIAFGMLAPDAGTIRMQGRVVTLRTPRDARALGLGMVHQHFTSIGALTVEENIRLAVGRRRGEGARSSDLATEPPPPGAGPALPARLLEGLAPDALVEDLSVAERQRLEIVKALAGGARILLLDEPSAVLAPSEVEELLGIVRGFVAAGGAAAFVTHKLAEVFAVADRVTVLRSGVVRLCGAVRGESEASLAAAMIGGEERPGRSSDVAELPGRSSDVAASGSTPVSISESGGPSIAALTPGLTVPSLSSGLPPSAPPAVSSPPASAARGTADVRIGGVAVHAAAPVVRIGGVSIHAGELIGVAAVEGNGQRELLRAIAGVPGFAPALRPARASPALAGSVGVEVVGPVAFVPEDRTTEGLIPELSVTENVVLALGGDRRWARGIRLDWAAARARTAALIRDFGIRAEGPDAPAATLSGGNQQKVLLARALEGRPAVLVAENPTRGLDVRATAEVHARLRAAAGQSVAVILYSTDLDEVLELGQRVLVVRAGRVTEAPAGADRRRVGAMMLGVGAG